MDILLKQQPWQTRGATHRNIQLTPDVGILCSSCYVIHCTYVAIALLGRGREFLREPCTCCTPMLQNLNKPMVIADCSTIEGQLQAELLLGGPETPSGPGHTSTNDPVLLGYLTGGTLMLKNVHKVGIWSAAD